MVLTSDGAHAARALESGAMGVVGEDNCMQPELAVMQSPLAIANRKSYVFRRARAHMRAPELIVESHPVAHPSRAGNPGASAQGVVGCCDRGFSGSLHSAVKD